MHHTSTFEPFVARLYMYVAKY